ncbi:ISNCY family transposase [Patescibacteria group bacterium]|nr:ISNCY family transposase [Patescibacteria group bacterium]
MGGQIIMSQKELDRISIIEKLIAKRIKQKHAAKELSISIRQVQRIMKEYKRQGAKGLIHKSRGKISNHKMPLIMEEKILQEVRAKYWDFGPTFASEKLLEIEGIKVSDEKLRQLMIKEKIWIPKQVKTVVLHQMRDRRPREGELIQIDGSPHAWFENRGAPCCLIVFIDDATGKLKGLHFCKAETTNDYFKTAKTYIERYGIPLAVYSDKHSIFRINTKELNSKTIDKNKGLTQFGRAMEELKIELIFALSPQAKGRVERSNRTLQNRLVKEMRLANINTISAANEFAIKFIEKYNKKFAVIPKLEDNAHRELAPGVDLDVILRKQEERTISKNLTIQYDNKIYQIQTKRPVYTMKKQKVIIIENNTGKIEIIYKGNKLEYTIFEKQPKANSVLNGKELDAFLNNICKQASKKKHIPTMNHHWKGNYKERVLLTC